MDTRGRSFTLVGLAVLLAPAAAEAQAPGHGYHPPLPDQQFFLRCRLEGVQEPAVAEVALQIPSLMGPAQLDQLLELPAPLAPIRAIRYLPQATRAQRVIPDNSAAGRPAIQLSVDGPTQSYQRWLVADDAERNRLISLIGTWRYMAVAAEQQRAELLRQFKEELTRTPKLLVSRPDGSGRHELAAQVGAVHVVDDLGCKLRVRAFHPHFAFDKQANKPVNQSDKRLNPAVLIEIEQDGKSEQRWVFARFPEFKAEEAQTLPYRVTLDCPLDKKRATPDFALVTIARSSHEVWTRHAGSVTAHPIAIDQRIDVAGSQYTFHIARFVPSGRLIEEYHPTDAKNAVTALQVETTGPSGKPARIWLESGRQRVISTENGRLVVWFGPRQVVPPVRHRPAP